MGCWLGHEWSQWQGEGEWATLYWRPIGAPEKRTCLDCGKVKRRLRPRRDPELGLTENGPPTTPRPSLSAVSAAPPTPRQQPVRMSDDDTEPDTDIRVVQCGKCGAKSYVVV